MSEGQDTSFVAELKRRKVGRVAVAYAGLSWATLDLAERALFLFGIAESLYRNLVIVAVAGFPVIVTLAWLFDLTGKGIERTPAVAGSGDGLPVRFTRQLVITGAIVILAMTGVGWRYMPSDRVQLAPDQITVLPFENQTGDPALDHLGVIAADHVVDGLGYVESFKTIAANPTPADAARATGEGPDDPEVTLVQAVAERTRSALVMTGSFFRAGEDVTFRARVYDAEGGEVVFSAEPVRADPHDPMAELGRLREETLGYFGMLSSRTSEDVGMSRRLVGGRAPPYAAYREYAEGVREFQAARYLRAAEQFELAASMDSAFFIALWRGSTARMNIGDWAGVERLVERMESLRSELAPAQHVSVDWARGQVDGDLRATHEAAVRGAEFVPTSPIVYLAGIATNAVNRPEEAIEHFSKYDLKWGGGWPWIWTEFAHARHHLGQYRRELWLIREGRTGLPEIPNLLEVELRALAALGRTDEVEDRIGELGPLQMVLSVAEEVEAHGDAGTAEWLFKRVLDELDGLPAEERQMFNRPLLRARALAALGRNDEAHQVVEALVESAPDNPQYRSWAAILAARLGDTDDAEEAIVWFGDLEIPYQRGSHVLEQARIAASLGDAERAVRFLERAFEQGTSAHFSLHVDPAFRTVRDDPAFQSFMEPKG
jgi:tetratricopeptide (TPR) repeat protein/TolB-like protein